MSSDHLPPYDKGAQGLDVRLAFPPAVLQVGERCGVAAVQRDDPAPHPRAPFAVSAVGLKPRRPLLGLVLVACVEYDRRRLSVRRRNVLAGIRFCNTLADHLAGESRDRLASVRRQLVQLCCKPVGQGDLQTTAHRVYPHVCSPAVVVLVGLVVVM